MSERPDISEELDRRLLLAIENRCTHPVSTPTIFDHRFGLGCAECLTLARDLAAVADDTVARYQADNGSDRT